jgi:hypothetical protein
MNQIDHEYTAWAVWFTVAAIVCALGGAIAGMVP